MDESGKTKKELIEEVSKLRLRVEELEHSEADRKRAEEKLKQYQFMVESAPDVIFFKDLKSRYIVANNKTLEAFGLPREQVIGKNDYEIMPNKEQAKKNIEDDKLVFKTGKLTKITKRMTGADGKERWFQAIKVPRLDGKGNITGLVGIARDITGHKQIEEALWFKTTLLEAQSETSIDGILVVDSEGKSILFNKRFGQMWNIPQRILNTRDDEKMLQYVLEQLKDPNRFLEKVRYLYAHKNEKSKDEIQFKDGRVFDRYSSPLLDSNGKYFGRIWYFRDITERRRMEQWEHERLGELAHASRLSAIGEMATGLAHDLNQPLCTILNYGGLCSQMIESGAIDTERLAEYLDITMTQAERAADIIRQIKSFARKQKPRWIKVDINHIVHEAAKLVEAEARRNQVQMRLELAEDISPVQGDAIQIEQVILNLIRNGFEAMAEQKADKRELTIQTMVNENGRVEVAIRDTGKGIKPELIERMFDSFFTTKFDGLGIGLSLSRSIIKAHEGRLWAVANPNAGATFRFTLPLAQRNDT